jgi:hypothetical protein
MCRIETTPKAGFNVGRAVFHFAFIEADDLAAGRA